MSETFASLSALEQELTFSSFSRADALRLGLLINEASQGYPAPVATEIVINGVVVYRPVRTVNCGWSASATPLN